MRQIIKTASEVKQVLEATYLSPEFWEGKGINPDSHFHDLTPEEISVINEVAAENVVDYWVEINSETFPALYGLREAGENEVGQYPIGKKKYVTDNNMVNRYLSVDRGTMLGDIMQGGYFASGPGLTLSSFKQFINGGTRGYGFALTLSKDATFKVLVHVEFGVPPQFRDLWDFKNREKKVKDLLFQNPSFMANDILDSGVDEFGEVYALPDELTPAQRVAFRNSLSSEYSSFAGFSLMRLAGKHIHSKADDRDVLRFSDRMADTMAERLCYEVYRKSLTAEGKTSDQFKRMSPAQWATALLLASNATNEDSSKLVVDWGLVDRVISALKSSTEESGPFAVTLVNMGKAFSGKKHLSRKGVFDAIVKSVKQFLEEGVVSDNPIPSETALKAKSFPTFGGVDIGYQAPVKE
jgi:hypothetical protein